MYLKGAIFDLDGTLLDSMGAWTSLGEKYLLSRGLIPSPGLNTVLRPMTLPQAAEYFRRQYGMTDSEESIVRQMNGMMEHQYRNSFVLKEFVLPFLNRLRQKDVKMCIATATDRPLVEAALERLNIGSFFCGIVTCYDTGCGKEKPDIYFKALELLKTSIDETVVFEKALHAIRTARAAGFRVAALYDENSGADKEEIKALSEWYLNSFEDFPFSH